MSKRKSIIYEIGVYVIVCALILLGAILCGKFYVYSEPLKIIGLYVLGAIIFGLINAFFHEFGHILIGKKNGFSILSVSVWFFKWTKVKEKFEFSFTMIGNEAGYTESVPYTTENLAKRTYKMTLAGPLFSLILLVLSVVPFVLIGKIPLMLYCFFAPFLPISFFYFAWNILPIISDGVYNDGAIVYSIKKRTHSSKVMLSLIAISSELYNGKTPAEIEKSLYFDLPVIPEDDIYFSLLLNAKYNYYLDKGDTVNALKIQSRLEGLQGYLPKAYALVVKADSLYNFCVLKPNGEQADYYMSELEKYLNNVNTVTNVRIKMAYIRLINEKEDTIERFYDKGIKEAEKCQLKGLGLFEKKLLNGLKEKTYNK